jgi:hypothetical protein
MNILPMVFVFIAILTSMSYYFVSQTQSLAQQQTLCIGFLKAQRNLINSRHKKIYKASKALKNQQDPTKKLQQKPLRDKQAGFFNLYYLLDPQTEKMAATCLQTILLNAYGNYEPFEKLQNPSFLKEFVQALNDQGKKVAKEKEQLTLVDLFPSQNSFRSLYYKMLKGTLTKNSIFQGYPSLENLCIFKKNSSYKFFSFPELSYQKLNWIFGEKIGKAIEEKEREINLTTQEGKGRTLQKQELEQILLQHRYHDPTFLLSHISFQGIKSPCSLIKGTDPSTQISLVWADK